jgi:recombinational DNA repair protein (RecF pathway)
MIGRTAPVSVDDVALTPLAQYIFEAADNACSEFKTESEFFETFTEKVLARSDESEPGIAAAIAEIVNSRMWPWRRT